MQSRRVSLLVFALVLTAQPFVARAQDTPAGIVAHKVGAGWVFTDAQGMSLYTYVKDKPGQVTCRDECVTLWPPVLPVSDVLTAGAAWSIVDRGDGTKQVAHRGMPLYRYLRDPSPGTTFGDGVGLAWHVAKQDIQTPPGIAISRGADGRALTDARGRTLYFNANDKIGSGSSKLESACDKKCLESWRPVLAPAAAVASGDWSIVVRQDGLRQWAFDGKPLYVPAGTSDVSDQVWRVAQLEPPPPVPDWLKYHPSDGGEVAATTEGFTVYAQTKPSAVDDTPPLCDADCMRTYWRPVVAAPDAKPVGNWTIVKGADGANQWAFKGELLFTHTRDKEPGEIAGARFFTAEWHTLTPSGQVLEGLDRAGG